MVHDNRPWNLSLSHPHASVHIEQKPLLPSGLNEAGSSNPQKIITSIVTDHPILNEAVQIGMAILAIALPLVIAGLMGDPAVQTATSEEGVA